MTGTFASYALDELRLRPVPLVPEIRLNLAEDATIFWARLEAEAGIPTAAPFWVTAWPGGQVLSRYVLDHPRTVRRKRVLDLASGSGLAAIAAALAGAAEVTANDTDPRAMAAIDANAKANGIAVLPLLGDILDAEVGGFDVVMVGDGLYSPKLAEMMLRFLLRQRAQGADVLVGDPGRGYLPQRQLRLLATYSHLDTALADAQIDSASVFRLT
jgi:predicted nicotinamide N-methyase